MSALLHTLLKGIYQRPVTAAATVALGGKLIPPGNTVLVRKDNDEALAYERKPRGAFGAKDGMHDDILITRAMALAYCAEAYMADIRRKRVAASIEACVHDKPPN